MPNIKGEKDEDKLQKISRNTLQEIHHQQSDIKESKTNRKNARSKLRDGNAESPRVMGRGRESKQADGRNPRTNTRKVQKVSEKEKVITQLRVRELFKYSVISGKLVRKINVSSNAKAGDIIESVTNTDGYVYVGIDGYTYAAHRIIWLYVHGTFPKGQIDHINHNRTDNRIENLRVVTNRENHQNRAIKNKSGHTGVTLDDKKNRWKSQVSILGKTRCIGTYKTVEEAICARKAADKIVKIALDSGVSL